MTTRILLLLFWFSPLIGALQAQPLYTPPAFGFIPSEQYFGEPVTHTISVMDEGAKATVRITAMRGVQLVMDTVVVVTYDKPFKFQLVEGLVSWRVTQDTSGLKRLPKLFDPSYQVTIQNHITSYRVYPYSTFTLRIYARPKA
jgi:hypothetical protein